MNDFKVPIVEVGAEVVSIDGRSLSGVFFMPALSAVQAGRMRPEEWINGRARFFPFRPTGSSQGLLLNTRQVLALIVAPDSDEEAIPDSDVPVRRVVIEAGNRRFGGSVVIDMPTNQQRVVDYVNRAEPFLLLRGDDRHYLIQKDQISRVTEVEGA